MTVSSRRSHSESDTFVVEVTFATEEGELPSRQELVRMIDDQLAGTLDETTGLRHIGNVVIRG